MKKFELPPRANLANTVLLVLFAGSAAYKLYLAFSLPIFAVNFLVTLALATGIFFKRPFAYATTMIFSFTGIALALKNANAFNAIIDALAFCLAFYTRTNLYSLKSDYFHVKHSS